MFAAGNGPGTVVTFGDSITDGYQSQVNANARWPNDLARRLAAANSSQPLSVVDEGISGNRVLNNSACFGTDALSRLDRDVLTQSGAKDVILLEGINDIGFSQTPNTGCSVPNTNVSAADIIAGYEQIISRVHAAGLKIFGATLTPFKGAALLVTGRRTEARDGEQLDPHQRRIRRRDRLRRPQPLIPTTQR